MAVAITYGISKVYSKPYYTASTTLLLDFEEPGLDANSILPAMLQEEYMATQLGILKSILVAEKAVKILGYTNLPGYKEAFEETYIGTGTINDWLEKQLLEAIHVKIIPKSRLIIISYTSNDAISAAEVPNAFSQAFRDVVLSRNLDPVQINAGMLDERIANSRLKLQEAKSRLNTHQKEKDVLISEDRLDIETLQLKTLTEKLASAKADVQILQSRLDQVNAMKVSDPSLSSLPEVMANQQVMSLQTSLYEKKTQLAEVSLKLGANHPEYKSIVREISSLEKNIRAESMHIVSRMENELKGANNLVSTLEKAKDIQKSKVIDLKQDTSDLPALVREVESAQRSFERALVLAEDNNLLAQINYTNVTVLDPAKIPDLPSGPEIKQNLLMAIILGSFLGLFFIILLEIRDRKIRSKNDLLSTIGDIPLLGVLKER